MRGALITLAAGAMIAGQPSLAQPAQQTTPFYRVVEHGRTLKVGSYGSYDPDCRSIGYSSINLLSAPQGGQVQTAPGRDYPNFATGNIRFRCNRERLPATILYYQASPRFVGTDSFTVEIVSANGHAFQTTWTIYVR